MATARRMSNVIALRGNSWWNAILIDPESFMGIGLPLMTLCRVCLKDGKTAQCKSLKVFLGGFNQAF